MCHLYTCPIYYHLCVVQGQNSWRHMNVALLLIPKRRWPLYAGTLILHFQTSCSRYDLGRNRQYSLLRTNYRFWSSNGLIVNLFRLFFNNSCTFKCIFYNAESMLFQIVYCFVQQSLSTCFRGCTESNSCQMLTNTVIYDWGVSVTFT